MPPASPRRPLNAGRPLLAAILCLLALAAAADQVRAGEGMTVWDIARLRSVESVAFSPDGSLIAYRLGVPRQPLEEEDGPAWSELHVVDAQGASRAFVSGQQRVSAVRWRPDGRALSFLAKRESDEFTGVYEIPIDGGEARRIVTHGSDIRAYRWSPDGSSLVYVAEEPESEESRELVEKGFTQKVHEEDWRPARLWIAEPSAQQAEARLLDLPGSVSEVEWHPAGKLLAVALAPTSLVDDGYMRRRVHLVEVASAEVVGEVDHAAKLGEMAWSPDGARLAFVAGVDLHDPAEGRLFVVGPEGGSPTDLVPDYLGHVSALAWIGADRLAFVGDEGVSTTLNRVGVEGSRREVIAGPGGPIWRGISASADGRSIALRGDTPRHPSEVFLASAEGEPERLTDSNPWLAELALGAQEPVEYLARDGLELEAILVRPLEGASDGPVPLVVSVHGGPEAHRSNGWLTGYSAPAQVLAAQGIATLYPNYRGSTGRGVEFSKLSQGDPAGSEFDDLVDAVDHLVAAGLVDRKRVGITGGSHGGYATAWGATYYSERFAAGVMFVGGSDQISKFGNSDIPNELYLVHLRSWPWENWQRALERSPIYYLDRARTPLLILHGEEDRRVFPGQSLELYRYLELRDQAPVRLVFYPGEGHGNRRAASRLDYSLRLVRWMTHYLQGPGGDPPGWEVEYRPEAPQEAAAGD